MRGLLRRTRDRVAYVALTFAVAVGVVVVVRYVLAATRDDGGWAWVWVGLAAVVALLTVDALRRRSRRLR